MLYSPRVAPGVGRDQIQLWEKRMRVVKVALLAAVFLVGGCATILNEETQRINVASSNGKPIKGNIDGLPFEGPGIVAVKRAKADKIIVTDTEGCTKQTNLASTVDGKFFINILSGGAFGSTTDYSTEEMWKYSESVTVTCG
jgi:hypothetical protein